MERHFFTIAVILDEEVEFMDSSSKPSEVKQQNVT